GSNAFAGKNGRDREEALPSHASVLIIVHELERAFLQLQHREIRGCAHVKCAAAVKDIKCLCCVDGCACNDLIERHAEHQKLRHDIRKIDDLRGASVGSPVCRYRIRKKSAFQHLLGNIPSQVAGAAVAHVEADAASTRSN